MGYRDWRKICLHVHLFIQQILLHSFSVSGVLQAKVKVANQVPTQKVAWRRESLG
jgi:hypothetical protein